MGVPWAFLGCLKVSLEAPVEHSGGLVGVPGVLLVALRGFIRFWVALGAVSGKIREILGSQNGAQNEKKTMQKSIKILMRLGVSFWNVFNGFWEAKWGHVATKNAPKIDPNFVRPILQQNL